MTFGRLVTSPIAEGPPLHLDPEPAQRRAGRARDPDPREHPGVQAAQELLRQRAGPGDLRAADSGPEIRYQGQIVACVVAETPRGGARGRRPGAGRVRGRRRARGSIARRAEASRGSRQEGCRSRATRPPPSPPPPVTSTRPTYRTPIEHHNPIELYATTASWRGGDSSRSTCRASPSTARTRVAAAARLDRGRCACSAPTSAAPSARRARCSPHTTFIGAGRPRASAGR